METGQDNLQETTVKTEQQSQESLTSIRDGSRNALGATFGNYLAPFVKKNNPRIISVGSAFGWEAGAVIKLYPDATFLGIDIDRKYAKAATKINEDLGGNVIFETRDARDEAAFESRTSEGWDVVMIRHPQVKGSMIKAETVGDWQKIIRNGVNALDKQGTIFLSTDTLEEGDDIKEILESAGIEVVVYAQNATPTPTPFSDRFIIIGKKNDI